MQCCLMFDVTVNQSGQVNAAAGASAGDDAAGRHPSHLNSVGATGGRGLQSTPGISRLTPGDSAPAAHDYSTRAHAEAAPDMHVNSRLPAEHAAANSTSLAQLLCNVADQVYCELTNTSTLP